MMGLWVDDRSDLILMVIRMLVCSYGSVSLDCSLDDGDAVKAGFTPPADCALRFSSGGGKYGRSTSF